MPKLTGQKQTIFLFLFLKELIKHYDKIKITWLTRGFGAQKNENSLLEKIRIKISKDTMKLKARSTNNNLQDYDMSEH